MKDFFGVVFIITIIVLPSWCIFDVGYIQGSISERNEILSKTEYCKSTFLVGKEVKRCWEIKEIE